MRRFTRLFRELDESVRTRDKEAALERYFREAPARDASWALWFLWGNRPSPGIPPRRLRQWAADLSGHPDWLVEACYRRVGDLAETASLLLPLGETARADLPLHTVIEEQLLPLKNWDDPFQFQLLREFWLTLDRDEALVLNKMLTGTFRIGVSRLLLLKALSSSLGIPREKLACRLHQDWVPSGAFFRSLGEPTDGNPLPPEENLPPSLLDLLEDIRDSRRLDAGEPPRHSAHLVMTHAHAGHGSRQAAHGEYALSARDGDGLVTVAKVAADLPDAEVREIEAWIRASTKARRGPVSTVPAELVFEIGFEGLRPSNRHKSGLVLRFPRILRWQRDTPAEEIDTIEHLRTLLS